MHQALEITANVTPDHELRIRLPEDATPGPVRVIVLFESQAPPPRGNLGDLLDRLPLNTGGGLTHEEILARIADERAAWGEE